MQVHEIMQYIIILKTNTCKDLFLSRFLPQRFFLILASKGFKKPKFVIFINASYLLTDI